MLNVDFSKRFENGFSIDVSFSIDANTYNILLGPSGAGKSVTLKAISGFERIDKGYIRVKGKDISRLPVEKRNIVYLPQNLGLFPHLTVREHLYFSFKAKRLPINHELISKIIKESELNNLLDRLPEKLSGGERQRVALARAIVSKPDILLLDEPLASLDFHMRMRLIRFLKKIKEMFSLTIIHVTHDPIEAVYLGEKIFVIENGKINFSADIDRFWNFSGNGFIKSIKDEFIELDKIIWKSSI